MWCGYPNDDKTSLPADQDWQTSNLNMQSSKVFQLVMTQFPRYVHFFLKVTLVIIRVWVTAGAQTTNGIFQTSNNSTYMSLYKTCATRIIPVKLFYFIFPFPFPTIHNTYVTPIRSAGITDTLYFVRLQMGHLTFLIGHHQIT